MVARRLQLVALFACAAGAPPLPLPTTSIQGARVALAGGGIALARRAARGRPPPLRSVLGGREEAALVEDAHPGAIATAWRAVVLLLIFLPVLLLAPIALLVAPFRSHVWFWLVKSSLARAGTAFIKWGQWAATRPDMFPERLCAALSELHSAAPVHSFAYTKREVEAALGAPIDDMFETFDHEPLASGSIAQIHNATLRAGEGVHPRDRAVAVKVRHPRVVERIVTDFTLMRVLAEASARVPFLAWLNLRQSVAQFSGTMVAQTRLDIEGEHLRRFGWNFGDRSWHDTGFPRVVEPRRVKPSRAVLVESLERGTLVSKLVTRQSLGLGGEALERDLAHFIVSRGEDVYLKMLLADNLMHADLHPGNLLLDSPPHASPRIVLLDVGMVARLTNAESTAFIGLLHACGAGDGRAGARAVLRFSDSQDVCVGEAREAAFAEDMHKLFLQRCRGYGTGVEFGAVLRGVLGLVRTHRVSLDANYMTLVMNVLVLEGMATVLLPEYNVLDAARPLLTAHRILPRPVFVACMPLIRRVKRARDAWWMAKSPSTAD